MATPARRPTKIPAPAKSNGGRAAALKAIAARSRAKFGKAPTARAVENTYSRNVAHARAVRGGGATSVPTGGGPRTIAKRPAPRPAGQVVSDPASAFRTTPTKPTKPATTRPVAPMGTKFGPQRPGDGRVIPIGRLPSRPGMPLPVTGRPAPVSNPGKPPTKPTVTTPYKPSGKS